MIKDLNFICFDLDGTISDSSEGIFSSYEHACQSLGVQSFSKEQFARFIGEPLRTIFKKTSPDFDSGQIEEAVTEYRKKYLETGMYENVVYPGMPELLAELAGADLKLYVTTIKYKPSAEAILKHFDLAQYFQGIYAPDDKGRNSDKTQLVAEAIRDNGVGNGAMIGDRNLDLEAGKINNLKTIGVLYGYGAEKELRECKPDFLVSNVSELRNLLLTK
jgi:phosphoglycolate phosphatase